MKLLPHFYQVAGPCLSHFFDATAYLLDTGEGLILLDCGTPEGFSKICSNIEKLGFDPADIREIWGTHGHYDHVGAASLWGEKSGARLLLHPNDCGQVISGDPMKTTAGLLYCTEFPPAPAEGALEDGFCREFPNGRITVLHTPGHTMGELSFHLELQGLSVLVAGDTLWGCFSAHIGSNEEIWKNSLDRLCGMHFDMMTFGHTGPSLACDADTRIAELRRMFANYYNPWFKVLGEHYQYN